VFHKPGEQLTVVSTPLPSGAPPLRLAKQGAFRNGRKQMV